MDTEEKEVKKHTIFGRDITEMPCFRNSFLYGIGGGIASGLAYFMFTSHVRHASHCTMATFTVTTMAYWMHCRYNYSKTKFELAQIKMALDEKVLTDGTITEAEIERAAREKGLDLKSV